MLKCWGYFNKVDTLNSKFINNMPFSNSNAPLISNILPTALDVYFRSITAGGRHTCASMGGKISCFGDDMYQQLTTPRFHTHDSKYISAGWDYTCSVNLVNLVACWGLNILGQLDVPKRFVGLDERQGSD